MQNDYYNWLKETFLSHKKTQPLIFYPKIDFKHNIDKNHKVNKRSMANQPNGQIGLHWAIFFILIALGLWKKKTMSLKISCSVFKINLPKKIMAWAATTFIPKKITLNAKITAKYKFLFFLIF